MSLNSRVSLVTLAIALGGSVMASGCGNKASEQTAKRETDRIAMQIEDLTAQRNALKEELDRVKQIAGQAQRDLSVAKTQLQQDQATLARTNSDFANAKRDLAAAQAQLAEARAKLEAHAAPAQPEQRQLSTPTTQPNYNK